MRIIVAIDSSVFSHQVVAAVARRVWPKDCHFNVISMTAPSPDWDAEQQFLRESQIILDERVSILKKALPGQDVIGEAEVGPAAQGILKAAEDWKADLIVLGSHGDTGIRKSHIGSVAAAVVNQAPCSVELIKVARQPRNVGDPVAAHGTVKS